MKSLKAKEEARRIYITFSDNVVSLYLLHKGQYYLPDESHWSIRFLKDVLSGKKKVRDFIEIYRHLS